MPSAQSYQVLQFGPLWVGLFAGHEGVGESIVGQTADEVETKRRARNKGASTGTCGSRLQRAVEAILHGREQMPRHWLNAHRASSFQRDVLTFTCRIPWGKTLSYGDVADGIGRPGSARAVGGALRRNPLPLFIPCHRVIGRRGDLCGYGGAEGIRLKQVILDMEQQDPRSFTIRWPQTTPLGKDNASRGVP